MTVTPNLSLVGYFFLFNILLLFMYCIYYYFIFFSCKIVTCAKVTKVKNF